MILAHALDDKPVPPENSKMLYEALQAQKIPAKYLELPSGGHGLNGYKGPMWDAWQKQSLEWLAEEKLMPPEMTGEKGLCPDSGRQINTPNWVPLAMPVPICLAEETPEKVGSNVRPI